MFREPSHRWGAAAAAVALAVRLTLIALVPVLPLGDSYARMFHATSIVQGPWLPGLQLEVALLSLITRVSWAFRVLTAVQAAVGVGFATAAALELAGPAAAAMALVALSGCPLLVWTSTGVYQEALFGLCVSAVAFHWSRGRSSPALGWLMAAEWVRYEAWLLAAVWALSRRKPREAALLAAFPLAWLALWRGLSPIGGSSLSFSLDPGRWPALAGAWDTLAPWWLGPGVLLLAVPGLISALDGRDRSGRFARIALAWGALDVLLLVVARPYSPAMNARQLGVAAWVVVALAVAGTARIGSLSPRLAWLAPVLATPPLWNLAAMNHWSSTEDARPAWDAGLALADVVPAGERVLVLAEGWPQLPHAEPQECGVVGVASQRDDRTVLCDADVPLDVDPVQWASEHDILWILRFDSVDRWRPVHALTGELFARLGGAELLRLRGAEPPMQR
jgi:hypothetical protein